MSAITIYHNPRCSKSRETMTLLQQKGIDPEVVLYLDTPPSVSELRALLSKLGISARELLRSSEAAYKELGLADQALSEDALLNAMQANPKLIQRPIVVKGARAVLGRPPENVLSLL